MKLHGGKQDLDTGACVRVEDLKDLISSVELETKLRQNIGCRSNKLKSLLQHFHPLNLPVLLFFRGVLSPYPPEDHFKWSMPKNTKIR